ncbi:MAG: adenylyl-sulfate kinase [Syntrophobacter sp.]
MDVKIRATNIVWHCSQIPRKDRETMLGQRGITIWMTGLPSSGKSTTAYALEYELVNRGFLAYVLDGDNVRHGLNKDLGFSARDREENIRRIAEVAKLFADSGIIVITSFISPYRKERDFARRIHNDAGLGFAEVFIDTPLEICEKRDPKCLYAKARRGELKGFTGVDDPYEMPLNPEFLVKTAGNTPEMIVGQLLDFLVKTGYLPSDPKVVPFGHRSLATTSGASE